MAAEQDLMAMPVIARSDPYAAIEPFSHRLMAENSKKWCASMPWDYPTAGTKEAEDEFLLKFFTDHELHMQGGQFLAQVWKCIALYNAQFRIPVVVEKWIAENTEIWKDPTVAKNIFNEDAQVSTVFGDSEINTYPRTFLEVAVKGVQTRLKSMGLSSDGIELQKSTEAVISPSVVLSAGNNVELPTETVPSANAQTTATTQIEMSASAPTDDRIRPSVVKIGGQPQMSAVTARNKPFYPRANGASSAYTPPDHRQLNYKKPRGTNGNSFSARNGSQTLPPPGFEDTRQHSNHIGPAYGPPPVPNPAEGMPYIIPGRGPSGGYHFGGNEQIPPHMQFQQPQGPQSGAYMPPMLSTHAPRYPTDQAIPVPRLYDPASHGTHMPYTGPHHSSQQGMPPMADRTNLQANAPSFRYEPPMDSRDFRGPNRRDSVTSRGGKRGYNGSMRGKNSRGGRDSLGHSGNISHESNTIHDTKPRYIIQRERGPLTGPWRNNHDENSPMPSQDARNSISEHAVPRQDQLHIQKSLADPPLPGSHTAPDSINLPKDKPHYSANPCRTSCSKHEIADDCTTATKLIVFDAPDIINEADVKAYFSQFGEVIEIGGPHASPKDTTHFNLWITFATVNGARKCLTARGMPWPFGTREYLQAEVAKQHWDQNHKFNQPQYPTYAPSASCSTPFAIQTTIEPSGVLVNRHTSSDEAMAKSSAADGLAAILSQDTTPAASGTNTPKKKTKSNKKKKAKKTDILAEATSKALAEGEPRSDHQSKSIDAAQNSSTVADDQVSDVSEAQETTRSADQKVSDNVLKPAGIEASKLQEQPADNSVDDNHSSLESAKCTTPVIDQGPSVSDPTAPSVSKPSADLPAAVSVKQPDSGCSEPAPGSCETGNLVVKNTPAASAVPEAPVEQQGEQTTSGEGNSEVTVSPVQSPPSLKSSKKAPIPKVPGLKSVSIALPKLEVKITPSVGKESASQVEQKDADVNNEIDKLPLPKQRSTSGDSEGTAGYFTAPNTPAVGNVPTQSTDGVEPPVSSVSGESKAIKPSKLKGPDQTESLSVFSNKAKKDKRKVSKSAKGKDSIKGKPASSDGSAMASQGPSRVTSGMTTPMPPQQPLLVHEPLQTTVRESIEVPHPDQCIHEPVASKTTAAASKAASPTPGVTASPPRPSRRGTISSFFSSLLKGDSQEAKSGPNGSKDMAKIEDGVPQSGESARDSVALAGAHNPIGHDTDAQAHVADAVGLSISNDAAGAQPKSKKKKNKSKGKKDPQSLVTAFELDRIGLDENIPTFEYGGYDASPDGATQIVDSSASSDSPSGRRVKTLIAQSQKHIVEPKPLRKTHKRAASSKLTMEGGTDSSTAVVKSNRRGSKEVSATARRSTSPAYTVLLVSPRADAKQVVEHLLQYHRNEDTDANETDVATDCKVVDVWSKESGANDRVSPEVEGMRARLNELQQKEQEVKLGKIKEKAVCQ